MAQLGSMLWVWRLDRLGSRALIRLCHQTGSSGVLIKTRDGRGHMTGITDRVLARTAGELRTEGIDVGVWGWSYPAWGPIGTIGYAETQARNLAADAKLVDACAVVNNAEAPWSSAIEASQKRWGSKSQAAAALYARALAYHRVLASEAPDRCVRGLSTFPRPKAHALPWDAFRESDPGLVAMPQVYFRRYGSWPKTVVECLKQWNSVGWLPGDVRITGPAAPWKDGAQELGDGHQLRFAAIGAGLTGPMDWWHAGELSSDQEVESLKTANVLVTSGFSDCADRQSSRKQEQKG